MQNKLEYDSGLEQKCNPASLSPIMLSGRWDVAMHNKSEKQHICVEQRFSNLSLENNIPDTPYGRLESD